MAKCENKLKRLSRRRWHTLSHSLNYCVWPFVVIALLLLSPSVFWSKATAITASTHIQTSWRIHIDLWFSPYFSRRAILRSSEQNWGVHCSCFACLLSVSVCACVCVKGRHVGKFSLHFFLFMAVLRAQVYYLICFVMYTLQRITFEETRNMQKVLTSTATSYFVTHLFVLFLY